MKVLNSYDIAMVSGGLISDSFSERENNIMGYGMHAAIGGSWTLGMFGVPLGIMLLSPLGFWYGAGIGYAAGVALFQGALFIATSDTEVKLKQV